MFKDKDKQREAIALCRHCGKGLELVPGKVQRQFCNDAHRKAYKRAEQRANNVPGCPTADEPRTISTKLSTSDNIGQPKRGKDIKTFKDLPIDVQQTIHSLSLIDGEIDLTVLANRTAAALNYQHQHQEYEKNYHG